jgi:formamidopyrimidine-DNA glycosylase
MSEGPEVKRTADKISETILGKTIVDIHCKTLKDNSFYESFGRLELQIIYLSQKNNNY